MWLINIIKVAAIWLCDLINKCYDPFEQATLPVITSDLSTLELWLFSHLKAVHATYGSFAYEIPMPDDAGDYALFQGLYLAMLAFKGEDVAPAYINLKELFRDNVLLRGFRADGTPNDTTSNDSATGVLFGLWAMKEGDVIVRWAQKICDSGYALTDLNGVPTKYGQLEQGWKTDPLRITLLLAILAVARLTDPKFDKPYYELFNKYKLLLPYPKVKLLWWDTDYDTHRATIHLRILYDVTGSEVYAKGLRRIHRIMRKSNNAWVEVLCAPALDPKDVNLSALYTFTYDDRVKGTLPSINSGTVESVKWGDNVRAKQTLPIYKRGSQEFFWQRNMFSLDEWVGRVEPPAHHSGLDFLICYWLAKRQGLL